MHQDSSLNEVVSFLEWRAEAARANQPGQAARHNIGQPMVEEMPFLPLAAKVSVTKAPSPRHWLGEPLSVSVGRNDSQQHGRQAGMAAITAERILARGAAGRC